MASSIEDEILRGLNPPVVTEQAKLVRTLEQSRSTSRKRQAIRDFRTQLLRDERLRDHHLPNIRTINSASPVDVRRSWLRRGWNVLAVQTPGAVTLRLPANARSDMIITIKDQRGSAANDPISLEVYQP